VCFQVHEAAGEEEVCVDFARELEARSIVARVFTVGSRVVVVLGERMGKDQVTKFGV
jgi:hypothetical protein